MKINKKWDLYTGIFICAYIVILNILRGKISFSFPFIILGSLLIIYHFTKDKLKANKITNKLLKASRVIISVCLAIFIIGQCFIIGYPKWDTSRADYVLVLGAGINGTKISTTLKQRLDRAIKYLSINDVNIIVSGGMGPGEDITEAEAMKSYLVSKGVNESKIIVEDKSTSTSENFKFSKDVIEKYTGEDVKDLSFKVVTSDFHAFRSSILAKRNGYENVSFYTNITIPTLMPIMYTREFFALIKSYLFDR
ncbi:YdcF family protein [Clostridium sp.]|uniref:YdcF family protein n=1 Tax=Clostridium sp. TaxID=1506 RepID=UPI003F359BD7